ncbi:MAG: ABC transporter permease [Gammaproteobacteria bacterium]
MRLANVYRLGVKEMISLRHDPVLVLLIIYAFTFSIVAPARGVKLELVNASAAVVDEDRSLLSRRILDSLREPYFQKPERIDLRAIDPAMDAGRYTFVIDIPRRFQADLSEGKRPAVQVNVDATAMAQAGAGARYIEQVIAQEVSDYLAAQPVEPVLPVTAVTRLAFNPNGNSAWFLAVMQLINMSTLLGILSLFVVVRGVLDVPLAGSVPLFLAGLVTYLLSLTAIGILLATVARSMPQFGLLSIPVFLVMYMLSGANTPLDAMPQVLQDLMRASPTTHFVAFSQAVVFRGAGIDIVWPQLLATAGIGAVAFVAALARFRRTVTLTRL